MSTSVGTKVVYLLGLGFGSTSEPKARTNTAGLCSTFSVYSELEGRANSPSLRTFALKAIAQARHRRGTDRSARDCAFHHAKNILLDTMFELPGMENVEGSVVNEESVTSAAATADDLLRPEEEGRRVGELTWSRIRNRLVNAPARGVYHVFMVIAHSTGSPRSGEDRASGIPAPSVADGWVFVAGTTGLRLQRTMIMPDDGRPAMPGTRSQTFDLALKEAGASTPR